MDWSTVSQGFLTAGFGVVAGAAVVSARHHLSQNHPAQNNIACGTRQSDNYDLLNRLMDEDQDIGSILLSTGEHAHIYVRDDDDGKVNHATYFHNVRSSLTNYNMALRDLRDPVKIYERALNPDRDFSETHKESAKKMKAGSWANNDRRRFFDFFNLATNENSNRQILNRVSEGMMSMLSGLAARKDVAEDVVPGRDHVAVKYAGDDGKKHFLVMPANTLQKKLIDQLIVDGKASSPKAIIEAISEQAETLYPREQDIPREALEQS